MSEALALPGVVAWPYVPIIQALAWASRHQEVFKAIGWGILGAIVYLIVVIVAFKLFLSLRGPKDPRDED